MYVLIIIAYGVFADKCCVQGASWTWFDIAVTRRESDGGALCVKLKENRISLCLYPSHCNPPASTSYRHCYGREFRSDSDLWDELQPGDCLAVYAVAIYPGWYCYGRTATLRIWDKFAPICITR